MYGEAEKYPAFSSIFNNLIEVNKGTGAFLSPG